MLMLWPWHDGTFFLQFEFCRDLRPLWQLLRSSKRGRGGEGSGLEQGHDAGIENQVGEKQSKVEMVPDGFSHKMQWENLGSVCGVVSPPNCSNRTKSNLFRLEAAGLPCPAWGVGSTPSCSHQTDGLSSLTEVFPSEFFWFPSLPYCSPQTDGLSCLTGFFLVSPVFLFFLPVLTKLMSCPP